jgi:pilus assembly protein CpaC
MKILKLIYILILSTTISYAYEINDKVIYQKDFENKTIYLPLNNYRTLIFKKRIKNMQLTNSENITAEFIENKDKPLKILKVLGKKIGSESAIVTLESGESIQINFSIMQNLDSIISLVKSSYPNLIIEQANDTIILKGYVKDYKEKNLVIDIFKKAGISIDEKLVDMIETSAPSKMIRVKLYAVEIKNDEGLDLKNNWTLSSKNFFQSVNEDGLFQNNPIEGSSWGKINSQRIIELDDALDATLTNAVSLSGGLSGVANYLGKYFNAGLVLQYLATEGVANILDETTLITLENKEATFHAGGTIRLKTQTTTAEGVPSTNVEKIKYGLQLQIKAKNVMKDNYIDLEITTSNTKIDWANQVDDIPSFLENEVTTNVLAKDGATIILGGLVNNQNSYDLGKIPVLGDIPVLGFLFRSKSFKEGKSELVFFITPEVVDPSKNDQTISFKKQRKKMLDTSKYKNEDSIFEKDYNKKEEKKKEESSILGNLFENKDSTKPELTKKERQKQRVNKILGYE